MNLAASPQEEELETPSRTQTIPRDWNKSLEMNEPVQNEGQGLMAEPTQQREQEDTRGHTPQNWDQAPFDQDMDWGSGHRTLKIYSPGSFCHILVTPPCVCLGSPSSPGPNPPTLGSAAAFPPLSYSRWGTNLSTLSQPEAKPGGILCTLRCRHHFAAGPKTHSPGESRGERRAAEGGGQPLSLQPVQV